MSAQLGSIKRKNVCATIFCSNICSLLYLLMERDTVSETPCLKAEDSGQCKTKNNKLFMVERCITPLYYCQVSYEL